MNYTRCVNVWGQIVDIKLMTDKHIENCIKMIESDKQKNGTNINEEWIDKHGAKYLKQFQIEFEERRELREVRNIM